MKKDYVSPEFVIEDITGEEDILSASNPLIAVDHHTKDPDLTNWDDITYVGELEETGEPVDGISDWIDGDF